MQIHVWTGLKYVPQEVYENMQTESSLDALKTVRKQQCERVYYEHLLAGYYDSTLAMRLAATQHDQNVFGNYSVKLMQEETADNALLLIADSDGGIHEMTYSAFKGLMKRYSDWCLQEWAMLAFARNAIAVAQDEIALEAIVYE